MPSPALLFLCALGLSSVVFAGDDVAEKVAKLRLATTAVERTKLLKDNEVGIFSILFDLGSTMISSMSLSLSSISFTVQQEKRTELVDILSQHRQPTSLRLSAMAWP